MSYSSYGRGRGYRPRGTRAKGLFNRPRFLHSPFRHMDPPRPRPGFIPWQPNNIFHQPPLLRGNPQFRPGNKRKKFNNPDVQYSEPGRLPVSSGCEVVTTSTLHTSQIENNNTVIESQPPLLGSEEERQQKIIKTVNQLKQKLSSLGNDKMTSAWSDDVSFSSNVVEDGHIENKGIPELRYEAPEINLTYSDLKDIGKINSDNSKLDNVQHIPNTNNTNSNIILDENEDKSQVKVTSCGQMPNLEETDVHPMNTTQEPTMSTMNLQDIPLPIDSSDQISLQQNLLQIGKKSVTDLKSQKDVLSSQIHKQSSTNCTLPQSTVDNSKPPKLSPQIEQELPVDFDPSTPPPILLIQDQSRTMPSFPIYDIPPLFNPMEPPPNMRHLLVSKVPHENTHPAWNINVQNQASVPFKTREMHTELTIHSGFTPHQLTSKICGQNFDPSYIDTINFPASFSVPSSSHSGVIAKFSSVPSDTVNISYNAYKSLSSPQKLIPFSDVYCNVNEDALNDIDEATKFAKQMTNITDKERENKISKINSKTSLENCTLIKSVYDVDSISLPPEQPKSKTCKLKGTCDIVNNKMLKVNEQRISNYLPEESMVQDVHLKCKDTCLMDEQDRPKVAFNLKNKTRKISTKTMWRKSNKEKNIKKNNGMTSKKSKKLCAVSTITKNNFEEDKLRTNQNKERNARNCENNLENTVTSESTQKKIQKDINLGKSPRSNVSFYQRVETQKSTKSHIENNESTTPETSWKNKIINRFLKMSKNDIYNMVNNTSLRKFNIIMKHLVKEKKPMLSLEMRQAQDEKMKLYDQQEFMKQLNEMLDPDATVSITDLPTEFIQHLNEVLQLDIQSHEFISSSNQSNQTEDINNIFSPEKCTTESISKVAISNDDVNREYIKNKNIVATRYDKNAQSHNTENNDLNVKDYTCNNVMSNDSSANNKLPTLQRDLDDIFSELTKKSQVSATIHTNCSTIQRNAKKYDNDTTSNAMQRETCLENDVTRRSSENCARWLEKCERWKRKEQEDPYAYRNLTKEEWEAKYGTQLNSIASSSVAKKIGASDDNNLPNKNSRHFYQRRRHSSETSKYLNIKHKSIRKDKYKQINRHTNDRKGYAPFSQNSSEYNSNTNSDSSSDSRDEREPNVTKLLRVIKEKEKVGKEMSLNETIRDEVNAEIERQRKEKMKRKDHKSSKYQREKIHYTKNKQQDKRTISPSDFSNENSNKVKITRILTENEIKKESIENLITQEVIIKEELDIGQEENSLNSEFVHSSSNIVLEDNATCILPESNQKLESLPLMKDTPTITNTVQAPTEDKSSIASPTQPKTKAQLKQMPETADIDDNKISLNIPTNAPENTSEIPSTTKSDIIDNNMQIIQSGFGENPIPRRSDLTTNTPVEPCIIINTQHDNVISTSTNISNKTLPIAASTLSVADMPIIPRQEGCKKIDIKTYYERTIQRRMNERELKKYTENSAVMQDLLPTSESIDGTAEIATNTSTINPIKDPRLVSSKLTIIPFAMTNTVLTTSENDIQEQEAKQKKESEITDLIVKGSSQNLNNFSEIKDPVNKIEISKCKDKGLFGTDKDDSALTNIIPMFKTTSSKSKPPENEVNATSKILQDKFVTDPKKFKNIRSEGSKELKLKKEISKIQKAKKKSTSKSINLISTKKYHPMYDIKAENKEKAIEVINKNKVNTEPITLNKSESPCTNKLNTNDPELSEILKSTDVRDNELPYEINKFKEYSLNSEFIKSKNTEKLLTNIEVITTDKQLSSEIIHNERASGTSYINNANNIANDKTENSNFPKIISKIGTAGNDEKINKDNSSQSSDFQQSDKRKNEELSYNYITQLQDKKLNNEDISRNMNLDISKECDTNSIAESNEIFQLNDINTQSKNLLLINQSTINNIETDDINKNSAESNISNNMQQSPDIKGNDALYKKTAEIPTISNENSKELQVENGNASRDSTGSPFKGFLQDSILTFEKTSLFNLGLNKICTDKDELLSDTCNINFVTNIDNCKDMEIDKHHNYESITDYGNDTNICASENFNITFNNDLLASNKEFITNKEINQSDLIADKTIQKNIKKSPNETVVTILPEDNGITTGEGSEMETQLMNQQDYASNTELEIKESIFISEEEATRNETLSKDLTNKLSTTTDPNLSEALATPDETLRLSENQTAEHLNNHTYFEANLSTEQTSLCDKLPDFDSDEHLDNEMLYLDVRLQTTTFDNKEDMSAAHFSVYQQNSQYDVISEVTPESTVLTPCSDFIQGEIQKPEQYKHDLNHMSSIDDDSDIFNTRTSVEPPPNIIDIPRTLNIPTKAALKEATATCFLKSPDNVSTITEEAKILKKAQQNVTDFIYQIPTHHIHNSTEVNSQQVQSNRTSILQDIINVGTISSTQNSVGDTSNNRDISAMENESSISSTNIEKCLCSNECNSIVGMRKMKELDSIMQWKAQRIAEKTKDIFKDQSKCKETIIHRLKGNRLMKYQSKRTLNGNNLANKFKNIKKYRRVSDTRREAILARMLEIDIEMHKLVAEKLKLHEVLKNSSLSTELLVPSSDIVLKTQENNRIHVQSETLPRITSQLIQNTETNCVELNKQTSLLKQSSIEQNVSYSSDDSSNHSQDQEIIQYRQKIITPTIQREKDIQNIETVGWAKKTEGQIDEKTEQRMSPSINSKKIDLINTCKNVIHKPKSNDLDMQGTSEIHNVDKNQQDIDQDLHYAIYLNKNADDCSESRSSIEKETKDMENVNIELSIVPKTNCHPLKTLTHSISEPLSIYSDDSTFDSQLRNSTLEMREKKKSTGLALLEEMFNKELAVSRKMKAIARRKKKKQLNNFLKSVNSLTMEEEELPLSKLYIRKLQQKRDLLDSLSQKEDVNIIVDPKILENVEEVINAVAEDRVEDLYETQSKVQASNDILTIFNNSSVFQPDIHRFYADTETNANSDWPCKEKDDIDKVMLQQQDNNVFSVDESIRAFTSINQNKVPDHDEHNVEPDSSITTEGNLEENCSLIRDRICEKNLNNKKSRNFDIKVSVPKTLITNDFNIELLQKYKNTECNLLNTELVHSTTNTFAGKSQEKNALDKDSLNTQQTAGFITEKDNSKMEITARTEMHRINENKYATDTNDNKQNITTYELQQQDIDSIQNAQSVSQLSGTKFACSDVILNEDSGDSTISNKYDKVTTTPHVINISKPTAEETEIHNQKPHVESEQILNSEIILQDYQNIEDTNFGTKSDLLEDTINNDQHIKKFELIPIDPANEKSEEFSETSINEKSSLECISSSTLLFNKAVGTIENEETSQKLVNRKRNSQSTPIRRSSRYTNDNIKSKKLHKANINLNSNEQELSPRKTDLTSRSKSRSPLLITHNEIVSTPLSAKKNRITHKVQDVSIRKMCITTERKIENPVKSPLTTVEESTKNNATVSRKRKHHTHWQIENCKVRLIDCKHTLLKPDVNPEVLNKFGIITINSYMTSDSTCTQHVMCNEDCSSTVIDTATIPIIDTEKYSSPQKKLFNKNESEIEILIEKSTQNVGDNDDQGITSHVTEIEEQEPTKTQYTVHKGPILDIKVFEGSFLAASEDGKIYRYSQTSNGILNIYKGHKSAVTCLNIYKSDTEGINKEFMYSGSLDGTLRCYDIRTGALIKNPAQINSPIQCMDQAWGVVFIGTKSGHVSRFHIKTSTIKGSSIQFSDKSVLALKATNEGPRRILIVASRNQPITIRDAHTGLFLRTISNQKNHTVYSLMRHNNLIYCGTSSTSINVYDFTTGEQTIHYNAGVGIVCMRLYENLLFAGCYDGNIYVFDIENHKLVCNIPGPGNMLLSIEVVHNKIIAGSKDRRLHLWQMPIQVRALLHKIT